MATHLGTIGDDKVIADLNALALTRRARGLPSGMEQIGAIFADQVTRSTLQRVHGEPVYRLDAVRVGLGYLNIGAKVGDVMKCLREHAVPAYAEREDKSYAKHSTLVEAMTASGIQAKEGQLERVLQ